MTTDTTTKTATGVPDGADEPCPAIGANRIGLLTSEARARLEARFWKNTKVNPETGCLETTYSPNTYGYGMCGIAGTVTAETHRVAYVLAHGPIPSGLRVRHACHNPLCVNLAHLSLGTHEDNMRDMVEAGRTRQGLGSNPRKLTVEMAAMILGDRILGVPVKQTAQEFGVSSWTVTAIRAGRLWDPAVSAHIDAFLAAEATERDRKGN